MIRKFTTIALTNQDFVLAPDRIGSRRTSYKLGDGEDGNFEQMLRSGATRGKAASPERWGYVPQRGFLYVATRAISSRVNANYDGWPKEDLEQSWRTFIGRPTFVEHQNFDTKKTRGVILDAKFHKDRLGSQDDWWIELLIEVDASTYPKLAKAIIEGDLNAVSMGCDVDLTRCSVCGNEAHDVSEYCAHIPNQKGMIIGGVLCYEHCIKPSFFEISFVFDPADESALISDFYMEDGNQVAAGRTASVPTYRLQDRFSRVAAKLADTALLNLPAQVDTLREEVPCPQCGQKAYDGEVCESCGFVLPPEGLKDPDTEPRGDALVRRERALDEYGELPDGRMPVDQYVDQVEDAEQALDANGNPLPVDENGNPINPDVPAVDAEGNPLPPQVDENGNPIPDPLLDENGNPIPLDENGNPIVDPAVPVVEEPAEPEIDAPAVADALRGVLDLLGQPAVPETIDIGGHTYQRMDTPPGDEGEEFPAEEGAEENPFGAEGEAPAAKEESPPEEDVPAEAGEPEFVVVGEDGEGIESFPTEEEAQAFIDEESASTPNSPKMIIEERDGEEPAEDEDTKKDTGGGVPDAFKKNWNSSRQSLKTAGTAFHFILKAEDVDQAQAVLNSHLPGVQVYELAPTSATGEFSGIAEALEGPGGAATTLNNWMAEDLGVQPPYPSGSLLYWRYDDRSLASWKTTKRMAHASIRSASDSTPMICIECGAKFKKKIGPNTTEVKCPKCGGYDTEPSGYVGRRSPSSRFDRVNRTLQSSTLDETMVNAPSPRRSPRSATSSRQQQRNRTRSQPMPQTRPQARVANRQAAVPARPRRPLRRQAQTVQAETRPQARPGLVRTAARRPVRTASQPRVATRPQARPVRTATRPQARPQARPARRASAPVARRPAVAARRPTQRPVVATAPPRQRVKLTEAEKMVLRRRVARARMLAARRDKAARAPAPATAAPKLRPRCASCSSAKTRPWRAPTGKVLVECTDCGTRAPRRRPTAKPAARRQAPSARQARPQAKRPRRRADTDAVELAPADAADVDVETLDTSPPSEVVPDLAETTEDDDVTSLDSHAVSEEDLTADASLEDLETPVGDHQDQLDAADRPDDVDDGSETGFSHDSPPSKEVSTIGEDGKPLSAARRAQLRRKKKAAEAETCDKCGGETSPDDPVATYKDGDSKVKLHKGCADGKEKAEAESEGDKPAFLESKVDKSARLMQVFTFVEEREQLGLCHRADRVKEIARFERMPDAEFAGWMAATAEMKNSQLHTAGRRISVRTANTETSQLSGRVPDFGRVARREASEDETIDDSLALL
jgi:hypothetical protein